jgi:hypothetical protein
MRWHRLGPGLVALLVLIGALATSAPASGYYGTDRAKLTIFRTQGDDGAQNGFEGQVLPRRFGVCMSHRPVALVHEAPGGEHSRRWAITGGDTWTLRFSPPPGTYWSVVKPVVRFDEIDGKRRQILCRGAQSERFVVPLADEGDENSRGDALPVRGAFASTAASSAQAREYYAKDRVRLTMPSYGRDETGDVVALEGDVIPERFAVCARRRPVHVRFDPDDPNTGPSGGWELTNPFTWSTPHNPPNPPGNWRARVEAEARFVHIDGKRRLILCQGARSPEFVNP